MRPNEQLFFISLYQVIFAFTSHYLVKPIGPIVGFLVHYVNGRVLAMLGGLLCSISVVGVPLINNINILGLSLAVTGM